MGAVACAQNLPDAAKPSAPLSTGPAPANMPAEPLVGAKALLRKHKFTEAAAAFKALADKDPSSEAQTGLIRSLLLGFQVDEADEAAKKALATVATSPAVHAAVGDVAFREGRFSDAEAEYRAALKLDANSARGTFGMARMMEMVSMRKSAAAAFAKAHELDPEDEEVFEDWVKSLPRTQRLGALRERVGDYSAEEQANRVKLASAIAEKKPWVLVSELRPTEINMLPVGRDGVYGLNINSGFSLQVKFNDRASASLLLDSGVDGIVIGTKLAEKAGAVKIAVYGSGDQESVASYAAWIDKIVIGGLEFHNCVVSVSSAKDVEEKGSIGP